MRAKRLHFVGTWIINIMLVERDESQRNTSVMLSALFLSVYCELNAH